MTDRQAPIMYKKLDYCLVDFDPGSVKSFERDIDKHPTDFAMILDHTKMVSGKNDLSHKKHNLMSLFSSAMQTKVITPHVQ